MDHKIAIIGLGYVGLPLAVEFSKKYDTIGFDINDKRISELKSGIDHTREISSDDLISAKLTVTNKLEDIADSTIYIVTVPTPIDQHKRPDFSPLISASKTVASVLKKDNIVIYESTVYPGATEEVCVPILENNSGLKFNQDFTCGYSPERINPGDKEHTVSTIKKITSGSSEKTAEIVDHLYQSIISAGTHLASSIRVAEAAKVIENTQRDINIAFMNELAQLFNQLGIDTSEVLAAAGTKWNFLNFKPGLVGGHCIGVDPYYLTHKAQEMGHNPEIILAGRRINDQMGSYIAKQIIKLMIQNKIHINEANILLLGITFKENCPDIRNSKVIDLYSELKEFGTTVDVYDPNADRTEVSTEYGVELLDEVKGRYNVIVLAVSHTEFISVNWKSYLKLGGFIYDIKNFLGTKADYRL